MARPPWLLVRCQWNLPRAWTAYRRSAHHHHECIRNRSRASRPTLHSGPLSFVCPSTRASSPNFPRLAKPPRVRVGPASFARGFRRMCQGAAHLISSPRHHSSGFSSAPAPHRHRSVSRHRSSRFSSASTSRRHNLISHRHSFGFSSTPATRRRRSSFSSSPPRLDPRKIICVGGHASLTTYRSSASCFFHAFPHRRRAGI